jgi:GT2 family glycosyltransferase
LGGFDARFFMYGEEADLCLRARRQGLHGMICPDAEIVHYGGASETVQADRMVRLFRARSQLYAAHWRPAVARLGVLTLDLWALNRLIAFSAARWLGLANRDRLATWRKVWASRRAWHPGTFPAAESRR